MLLQGCGLRGLGCLMLKDLKHLVTLRNITDDVLKCMNGCIINKQNDRVQRFKVSADAEQINKRLNKISYNILNKIKKYNVKGRMEVN